RSPPRSGLFGGRSSHASGWTVSCDFPCLFSGEPRLCGWVLDESTIFDCKYSFKVPRKEGRSGKVRPPCPPSAKQGEPLLGERDQRPAETLEDVARSLVRFPGPVLLSELLVSAAQGDIMGSMSVIILDGPGEQIQGLLDLRLGQLLFSESSQGQGQLEASFRALGPRLKRLFQLLDCPFRVHLHRQAHLPANQVLRRGGVTLQVVANR